MKSLSLCLIARNEERFLAGCLESARGYVDEVVLVDTGSKDATVDIARAMGARLLTRPWDDDFAAARNFGLDAARGTHVLVLDADERLAPGAGEALRDAIERRDLLLGLLPLHNASALDARPAEVLAGACRIGAPVWVPRLFPRLPQLRFTRRVHETLARGFHSLRVAGLGDGFPVEAPLIHLGEVAALRAELGRDVRNERLMRLALAEDPRDGDLAGYLVAALLKAERRAEAREVGERVLPHFLRAIDVRPAGHPPDSTVRLGYALSFAQADTGAPEAALTTARECAARFPVEHANLTFAEAYALEKLRCFDEAEPAYLRCLALDGAPSSQQVLSGVTSHLARLRLGVVAAARGHVAAARGHLDQVGGPWAAEAARLRAALDAAEATPPRG